ncbi:uncharacterized protein LOC7458276 isoform X2 [Populus trichocarpa]|uniref:uncharacterized protein LOC7458276 isoform X2 n=1 Tax=Populus trichocarpa TaxID=3694 RepID=UPI002277E832|nr:uncharacterized protein LOC7458276 isoform X2 [Populus trichocarpa]
MALQAGVSTSKVLILVGAGLTSSIILKNGRLSELIGQLQELLKGVDQVEIAPYKYDSALLAAQIRQLAQEIKELTLSSPVTIYNGNSASNGSFSSYLVPAAALGAMGYCYMWWKVDEMKSNLSQIGYDVESIHQMISGLEGKLELLESKQDTTNSGLWHLCQFAGGFKDGLGTKVYQDVGAKLANPPAMAYEERSLKGLQFIAETKESDKVEKPVENVKNDLHIYPGEKVKTVKTRVHRSYPVGFSLTRDIVGSGI